jgi:hypothetical protein
MQGNLLNTMVRIPAKVTNERREQAYFLMLKGHIPKTEQVIEKAMKHYDQ